MQRLGALAILILCVTSTAFAQDGKLVNAVLVKLDDEVLTRLEPFEPTIRKIAEQVDIQAITYLSDGLKVNGYLVVPKQGNQLPCVIYNRGGNRAFGALTDGQAAVGLGKIAREGYIVVASQYRGNSGGEGREEFGGADVHDVLNLIPLLEAIPQADTSRIGMYGWSRGGMMTYLALSRTDRIAAAVVGAGMADAFDTVKRRPKMEKTRVCRAHPQLCPKQGSGAHRAIRCEMGTKTLQKHPHLAPTR